MKFIQLHKMTMNMSHITQEQITELEKQSKNCFGCFRINRLLTKEQNDDLRNDPLPGICE